MKHVQHTEEMKQGEHMDKICRGNLEHCTVKYPVNIVATVRYSIAGNFKLNKTPMSRSVFSCSFFTAVIYTHINIRITHFHLYHSVNIY